MANAATNLASQPYSQYPGQQVATPSGQTQQAWQAAGNNVGNYQPALQSALGLTQQASQPVTQGAINQYMNPYMQDVIGGLTSASNTNLQQNVLPSIQDRFVSAGQSRSPQEMQATNNALYQSQQALDQSIGGALQSGYQGALNTALQEQGVQQATGAQMGQLGALTQQLGAGDVGQLAAAGQGQDVVNQSNINSAMNNFYSQQQWPYQNLTYASNIIRGQAVPSNQMQVGMQYNPGQTTTASPLQAALGTTAGATALHLRRGGRVSRKRFDTGGEVEPGASYSPNAFAEGPNPGTAAGSQMTTANGMSGPGALSMSGPGSFPTTSVLGQALGIPGAALSAPLSLLGPVGMALGGVNTIGNTVNTLNNTDLLSSLGAPPSGLQQLGGALGANQLSGTPAMGVGFGLGSPNTTGSQLAAMAGAGNAMSTGAMTPNAAAVGLGGFAGSPLGTGLDIAELGDITGSGGMADGTEVSGTDNVGAGGGFLAKGGRVKRKRRHPDGALWRRLEAA